MPPVGFEPTISAGDLETSRIGAPYIHNVRLLRVKDVWSDNRTKHTSTHTIGIKYTSVSPVIYFTVPTVNQNYCIDNQIWDGW